jgi:hypothetical protein
VLSIQSIIDDLGLLFFQNNVVAPGEVPVIPPINFLEANSIEFVDAQGNPAVRDGDNLVIPAGGTVYWTYTAELHSPCESCLARVENVVTAVSGTLTRSDTAAVTLRMFFLFREFVVHYFSDGIPC